MSLSEQLKQATKEAMKAKDKARLGTIRMVTAAIKQIEIDEKVTLDDDGILDVLTKQVKQRQQALSQYQDAGRDDLAEKESAEIKVIESFFPEALSDEEVQALIEQAVTELNASGMQDMGKVVGQLRPQLKGRADMAKVSALVKARLTA